jgi:hypothetical protein
VFITQLPMELHSFSSESLGIGIRSEKAVLAGDPKRVAGTEKSLMHLYTEDLER